MTVKEYSLLIIDPHLHLFDLTKGDYHWLKACNPPFWSDKEIINKNFIESDLKLESIVKEINSPTLSGFVHIEAGFDNQQPWREIAWLEENCQKPFKAVAGIDITLPTPLFNQQLIQLKCFSSVVGCRYILDEQALSLLTNNTVLDNLASLAQYKLSFDLQMHFSDADAIKALSSVLKQLPELTMIINHAGLPPYWDENLSTYSSDEIKCEWNLWLAGIKEIAKFEQCAIKCSGWEMAQRNYSTTWQKKVIEHCIECFSEQRVMLASNFPLCLFHGKYENLWQSYHQGYSLNKAQLDALLYENAKYWYQF